MSIIILGRNSCITKYILSKKVKRLKNRLTQTRKKNKREIVDSSLANLGMDVGNMRGLK